MGTKKLTSVPTRKFLGALCLGLPAAMAAHFLTFGGAHTLGGAAHLLLIDAMVGAVCASVLALCAGAVYFAAAAREGSIVAARLSRFVPSSIELAGSATAWFTLIEHAEGAHVIPVPLAMLAVICVALFVRLALCTGLRLLSAAALRLLTTPFAGVERPRYAALPWTPPAHKRQQLAFAHFSRPPPSFS